MTRKSRGRLERDRQKMPRRDNIATVTVDRENQKIVYTTNDMLVNQLYRDGPRVAKSFDRRTKEVVEECSAVLGQVSGLILQHLRQAEKDNFEATVAGLLYSATNSYVASIQVARHGYPRQYGALARMLIETISMVIVLAIRPGALVDFHAGKLDSNKCVGWSKAVLPPLGHFWGMLSREFVHISRNHATFEGPVAFTETDEALDFIKTSMKGNIWLLFIVADLVFHDERKTIRFWRREGQAAHFDPSPEILEWSARFVGEGFVKQAEEGASAP
ncbi:hypothetical protein [Bosea sp. (in: a-proteobacteria)]|uniref:hypothetical protein n=1 Tax=Bosea sp. (in: a-proteobacteria) TaxID=1871050 RepID=UPI001AC95480|nr:hypothetical protein [Bosea sp. (in: a-proteobacteria)]MBN9436953.1 hypothetical protein [Bosea sp. (in: a-proteobacteria)]